MRIVRRRRSVAQRIESMLLVQARLRVWRRWIHVQSLLARVAKTPHPNDMLAMLAGTRCPLFKHGLLLTLQRGERTLQMRHRAHLPRRLLLLWSCTFAHKMPRRIVVLPCWLLRADNRQSRHVHKSSAQRRARAKRAFTARVDVASSAHRGSYCPAGVSNHIVIRAGMYTNANRTNVSACEVNFYCADGVGDRAPRIRSAVQI